MARAKFMAPTAEQLHALIDKDGRFAVRASPGASRDAIELAQDSEGRGIILVRVTAPPDKGKANIAICKLIAKALGVAAGDVCIIGGETARTKLLKLAH